MSQARYSHHNVPALLALLWSCVALAADAENTSFKDCAECPEMIVVAAGRFVMGAVQGEEEREGLASAFRHRSEPQRPVQVTAFAAGRFEITRGEYRRFAVETGRSSAGCFVWRSDFEFDPAKDWRDSGFPQDDTHPATCASWEDATAYVQWLTKKSGKRYRLLSEAEWEYAARAGSTTPRFWDGAANVACDYANGADLSTHATVPGAGTWEHAPCTDGYAYTAPAGSFRANAYGLHDMLGNVEEWTQDCWNANYSGAPPDSRAWAAGDCALRAVRGGSWDDATVGLRAAYRVGSPTTVRVWRRGFRVARDI